MVIVAMLSTSSCGPIQVDPIEVQHKVTFTDMKVYFAAKCEEELGPGATQEEMNACIDDKIIEFVEVTGFDPGEWF